LPAHAQVLELEDLVVDALLARYRPFSFQLLKLTERLLAAEQGPLRRHIPPEGHLSPPQAVVGVQQEGVQVDGGREFTDGVLPTLMVQLVHAGAVVQQRLAIPASVGSGALLSPRARGTPDQEQTEQGSRREEKPMPRAPRSPVPSDTGRGPMTRRFSALGRATTRQPRM
jgi:hypothetical protein